jgi:hypothetical protein
MKQYLAVLILATVPTLATALPVSKVAAGQPQTDNRAVSQPQTENRASSHDRHHRKHARVRHHHHKVDKHHPQH